MITIEQYLLCVDGVVLFSSAHTTYATQTATIATITISFIFKWISTRFLERNWLISMIDTTFYFVWQSFEVLL